MLREEILKKKSIMITMKAKLIPIKIKILMKIKRNLRNN